MLDCVLEDRRVWRVTGKLLAHATDLMSEVLEEIAQFLRDIMVQEEVHGSPADI